VATTTIGLLPIMFGTETGTRVMKRIAAPMVGGLVSSTILTLVIIPAIYLLWMRVAHRNDLPAGPEPVKPAQQIAKQTERIS
jgi:Cu(I)/Ag(I) efflux system membrane protein CusA/SilA